MAKFDFSGWATRNDLQCADGRIIRKDAFKHQDGETVSLVWNHQHDSPDNVWDMRCWRTETKVFMPIVHLTIQNLVRLLKVLFNMEMSSHCL